MALVLVNTVSGDVFKLESGSTTHHGSAPDKTLDPKTLEKLKV